jgi:asparagine synthase (glutamine-hydrolysing)
MPGIVGVISQRPPHECESLVRLMISSMLHEPFYESGAYGAPKLGIYGGWVAQRNSFASNQVFLNEQRDITILFSGECFTDRAVAAELREKGHHLDGKKGAWLAHLYEKKGSQFWENLNGLFSGLLIDKREGKAFLFNDRYGTERIYWHETHDAFYFASEAKALLRVLSELREFDQQGVAQFLTYGCTLNWRTLFRGVEILPGGSRWTFQDGTLKKERYFDSQTWEALPSLSPESFQEEFDETVKRILPRYFQSDCSLGIALTGGLDTRMILACKPENIERPVSYTFTGEAGETFDDRIAAEVARVCGLEHQLLRLGRDFFTDFASHVDDTVYVTDGCFGVIGAHEIYFNRQARELAPVRLTGLFGSEILRGVSYFKPSLPPGALLNPEFAQFVEAVVRDFAAEPVHPVTSAAFRTVPWNLFGSMAANRSQVVLRSPYLDNDIVALAYQTPAGLRKSPKAALRLIENNNPLLGRIPTDRLIEDRDAPFPRNFRWLVRETGFKLDYYHNEGMPHWLCRFSPILDAVDAHARIFGHHKFLHYRSWFRNQLAPYVVEVLSDRRAQGGVGFFNRGFLNHMAKAHTQGYGNYVLSINAVLTLEAVERLFFRDLPTAKTLDDLRPSPAAVSS